MDLKIALLTLLVIAAFATMITIAAVAFSEMPSTKSTGINSEDDFSSCTALSDLVQPLGEERGGGWP